MNPENGNVLLDQISPQATGLPNVYLRDNFTPLQTVGPKPASFGANCLTTVFYPINMLQWNTGVYRWDTSYSVNVLPNMSSVVALNAPNNFFAGLVPEYD